MKVYLFYRPRTESEFAAGNFLKLLESGHRPSPVKLVNVDTREGDSLARLYSIVRYPSVLVTGADGTQVKFWHGAVPLVDDLIPYLS